MDAADHQRARNRKQQYQRMQGEGSQLHITEPQVLPHRTCPRGQRHQGDQQNGGRDRRAFEVFDLAGSLGQDFRRDVITRQTRYAAGDEIRQDDAVVQTLHATCVRDDRWRDAE
jgi:hypothetical protein